MCGLVDPAAAAPSDRLLALPPGAGGDRDARDARDASSSDLVARTSLLALSVLQKSADDRLKTATTDYDSMLRSVGRTQKFEVTYIDIPLLDTARTYTRLPLAFVLFFFFFFFF